MKYTKFRKKENNFNLNLNFYMSNKKIRGKKKLIKNLDRWVKKNIKLDFEYLEKEKRDYLKLNFSPFYNLLQNRIPPLWYQRLLIKGLYSIYQSWYKKLSENNKIFYLKMWIMEKNIMNSQLVVAIDEKVDFYKNVFEETPIRKKSSLNILLNKFHFLDTMFIMPLLHINSANNLLDQLTTRDLKKIEKNLIKIINEKDASLTYIYTLDTVLLCSL